MRVLAAITIAVCICVCVTVIALAVIKFGRWRRAYLEHHSRWVDVLINTSDATYVSVQRVTDTLTGRVVLDEQHMGFVHHTMPNWDERVNALRMRAWERAIALNQPSLTE